MFYKLETQNNNAEKLNRKLEKENVPEFIRRYFIRIESKLGAINYWIAIRDLLLWLLDNSVIKKSSVSDITPGDFLNVEAEDITLYLRQKESGGMSPTTLETRKHIFSSFWGYLVSTKKCPVDENIIHNVKYKGIKTSSNLLERKTPTEEQIKQMEQKINKKPDPMIRIRNLAVLNLIKGTGIREGELAGLDISNLYLNEPIPYIKVIGKGKYREIEAKTVYLTGKAVIYLKEWLKVRELFVGEEINPVFINKNRKRLNENNIRDIFKNYGNGITPHMIRHWYATVLANKGKVILAQQQLGHVSQETTVNNYILGSYDIKDFLANM